MDSISEHSNDLKHGNALEHSDDLAHSDDITEAELDPTLSRQIRELCQQGYQHFDQGDHSGAIRQFFSAWTKLPKPQSQWQEAGWVLTALGDAYFAKGNYESGREALLSALFCPKTQGNPIIHMRLGQCLYELGDHRQAAVHFQQVLEHGGEHLFDDTDPKYRTILGKTTAELPEYS